MLGRWISAPRVARRSKLTINLDLQGPGLRSDPRGSRLIRFGPRFVSAGQKLTARHLPGASRRTFLDPSLIPGPKMGEFRPRNQTTAEINLPNGPEDRLRSSFWVAVWFRGPETPDFGRGIKPRPKSVPNGSQSRLGHSFGPRFDSAAQKLTDFRAKARKSPKIGAILDQILAVRRFERIGTASLFVKN